jgi:hypothetical protein
MGEHFHAFEAFLKTQPTRVTVDLSIDRDGKLANTEIIDGAVVDLASLTAALQSIQPFPPVPAALEAPYKFSAVLAIVPPNDVGHAKVTWADEVSSSRESSYRKDVASFMMRYPLVLSGEMKAWRGAIRLIAALSIDRDGRLRNAEIIEGTGSKTVDAKLLEWIKMMEPYPQALADLATTVHMKASISLYRPNVRSPQGTPSSDPADDRLKRTINSICRGC